MTAEVNIWGGRVTPLSREDIAALLAWVRGGQAGRPEAIGESEFLWALATALDGVTWLAWDKQANAWKSSGDEFPCVCGSLDEDKLRSLRLFGEAAEALIWQTADGLRGRLLADARGELEVHQKPMTESRLLIGREIRDCKGGFALAASRSGARQVLPLGFAGQTSSDQVSSIAATVDVKHYLGEDGESGAVRVVASRLVCFQWKEVQTG